MNFSVDASEGNAGQAAYGAAKAGIEGLAPMMAIELSPLGVRVNLLALGFIDVATTRDAVGYSLTFKRLRSAAGIRPVQRMRSS